MTISSKPDWHFVTRRWPYFFAFGFGSGLASKAPGTWGTLAAYPVFFVLYALGVQGWWLAALCVPLFVFGVWVCEVTGNALGVHDYGGIVWDEIVAMLLVLSMTAPVAWAWVSAFVLFRVFDIIKPWPIGWADERVHGGMGVMLDDLLAAAFAMVCQFGIQHWLMHAA